MASAYTFEKPSAPIDSGVFSFLEQFYRISDTPDTHDIYADQFTADATFIMASKKSRGTSEIRMFREGMWTHVTARKHRVQKVFACSAESPEVMLYGTVEYDLKNGTKAAKDWAGRAVLEKSSSDGRWRFAFYQIYMDTAS